MPLFNIPNLHSFSKELLSKYSFFLNEKQLNTKDPHTR